MTRRQPLTTRFALWVAVCALLLKAAVPMLATASAHMQGKTLVEVCTVYGVSTVALNDDTAPASSDHAAPHAADHCALTALVALDAPSASVLTVHPSASPVEHVPQAHAVARARDAEALWAAGLHHGPPAIS